MNYIAKYILNTIKNSIHWAKMNLVLKLKIALKEKKDGNIDRHLNSISVVYCTNYNC